MLKVIVLVSIFLLLSSGNSFSQACSCGGAPLLSSLESSITPKRSVQIGITYEFNSIQDLFIEDQKFDDDTRTRTVHSALIDFGYGLSDRITLSTIFSVLQQERKTSSDLLGNNILRARGFGDALFIVKYNLIPFTVHSLKQLSVGGGIKFPLGDSDLRHQNNLIAADLQPGTGSYDFVLLGNYLHSFKRSAPLTASINLFYRSNGTNDRFEINNQGYKFGNKFVSSGSLNYIPDLQTEYSLGFRFRTTEEDTFLSESLPNTGGTWIYLTPAFGYKANEQLDIRIGSRLPIYRNVNGTQLVTTFSLSLSIFYLFTKN